MSEQTSILTPEQAAIDYQAAFQQGLEQAREVGFDVEQALAADVQEKLDAESLTQRAHEVTKTAAMIAEDIGLQADYFKRPANTILMAGIASVWLQNQAKSESAPHNPKLADERAMLVDVALMAAGRQSAFVNELAAGGHKEAKRYVQEGDPESAAAKAESYLETINDPEMAERVRDLLAVEGEGSVLYRQRQGLGVTAETEDPFEVKVLQLGAKWDLINAGVLPKPEWPKDIKDHAAYQAASAKANATLQEQEEKYEVYRRNQEQYDEQFGEEMGDLAPAFVNRSGNKTTLYIKAATAAKLLLIAKEGPNFDEVKDQDDYSITEPVATVRHEYVHTQKNLAMGERMQLGLVLEERKAEYISHDKLGYQDVKFFLNDLGMAQGIDFNEHLEAALQHPDALSALMAWSATNLGLRNTLLLMAGKPLPYDRSPESAGRFASLKSLVHNHDRSAHDAIIRENLDDDANLANYRERAAQWAGRVVSSDTINIEFIRETYAGYREGHGVAHGNKYLLEALDDAVKAAAAEQEGQTVAVGTIIR